MVVILCGCDGTGKSTCFNLLKTQMKANFIKESHTDDVFIKSARSLFLGTKILDGDLTIYDRATLLDDLVYERVIANKTSDLFVELGEDNIKTYLKKCLIIYFDLNNVILTKRLEDRGDEYIKPHQINKIKHCYDSVFKQLDLKPVVLDTSYYNEYEVARTVMEIIETYEEP